MPNGFEYRKTKKYVNWFFWISYHFCNRLTSLSPTSGRKTWFKTTPKKKQKKGGKETPEKWEFRKKSAKFSFLMSTHSVSFEKNVKNGHFAKCHFLDSPILPEARFTRRGVDWRRWVKMVFPSVIAQVQKLGERSIFGLGSYFYISRLETYIEKTAFLRSYWLKKSLYDLGHSTLHICSTVNRLPLPSLCSISYWRISHNLCTQSSEKWYRPANSLSGISKGSRPEGSSWIIPYQTILHVPHIVHSP